MTPTPLEELSQTDPDLVTILQRQLDEVASADVAPLTAAVTRLGALIAVGADRAYRNALAEVLDGGVPASAVQEVVYQAVPYVGFARALDALDRTHEVFAEHRVTLPLPSQATTTAQDRAERGLAVQREIVGTDAVAAMYAHAPADEQHIQRLLSAHCFGDHYTRGGLDVPTRELLTLAILVALGGADPQVAGHVAANLRVGNDRGTMIAVLTRLLPYLGYPRTLNGLRAIDQVAPAGDRATQQGDDA